MLTCHVSRPAHFSLKFGKLRNNGESDDKKSSEWPSKTNILSKDGSIHVTRIISKTLDGTLVLLGR